MFVFSDEPIYIYILTHCCPNPPSSRFVHRFHEFVSHIFTKIQVYIYSICSFVIFAKISQVSHINKFQMFVLQDLVVYYVMFLS